MRFQGFRSLDSGPLDSLRAEVLQSLGVYESDSSLGHNYVPSLGFSIIISLHATFSDSPDRTLDSGAPEPEPDPFWE